jgi:hypothetical protein
MEIANTMILIYLFILFLIIGLIITIILLLIRGFGKAKFSWFIAFIPLLIPILSLIGVLIGIYWVG